MGIIKLHRTKVRAQGLVTLDPDPGAIDFLRANSSLAFPKNKQVDLKYVRFILNTEDTNANNVTFVRSEIVSAFQTPVLKPLNIEHIAEENSSNRQAGPWINSSASLDKPAPACRKPGASRIC